MKKNSVAIVIALLAASSFFIWYTFRKPVKISPDSIIVGTNADYEPFTFMKDDVIVGLDIDIMREIASRLNKKMILQNMDFIELIPKLQAGKIQAIAAGLTPTPDRSEKVLFTTTYIEGDPLLAVVLAKNKPITNISQLDGKRVIVNEGYVSDAYISKRKGPILFRFPSPAAGFLGLKTGRGDAFITAQSSARPFLEKNGEEEFRFTQIKGIGNQYALAVSQKYPELRDQIQQTLDGMEQDGTLQKIKTKWGF